MKFRPDGIGHLLNDLWFRVPEHQRSYAWEKENVLALFDDLTDAVSDPKCDDYFLGMIVLMEGDEPGGRLEVIDGQQRLATVSILIAAIRDWFAEQGDADMAGDVERDYLYERRLRSREPESRIHLNVEDRKFFEEHIVTTRPDRRDRPAGKLPPSHKRSRMHSALHTSESEASPAMVLRQGLPSGSSTGWSSSIIEPE